MLGLEFSKPAGEPLSVLCLGAHSDDIEIGCGGTLLRLLAERPVAVHWVTFAAPGEREAEARKSAADFLEGGVAATIEVHQFRESYFPAVAADIKDAFEALKARVTPDVVLTHRRDDAHQDHRTLAELTWNTFRNHLVLEYEIAKYEGDLGQPNLFVPLPDEVAARKVDLLMTHFATQRNRSWFRPDTFRALMTLRGIECNAPQGYAEAFHVRKAVL
jgi:LmbE family N-acetylglucosaminyl deacetylase